MAFVYQISKRQIEHLEKHPDAKVISLGIGDTTEPIPRSIASAMAEVVYQKISLRDARF